jgi:Flp pilus assembly protein TadG
MSMCVDSRMRVRSSVLPESVHRKPGFALIAFSLALVLLLGSVGLSFDVGRMYVTKSEAQAFVDSAAIAATLQLDGTAAGITAARNAASATIKGWQFGTTSFAADTRTFDPANDVEFGKALGGPWSTNPGAELPEYVCVRVTTRVSLPMLLMPIVTRVDTASIAASAVAKQIKETGASEGVFPFSPYAHPAPNAYTPDAPLATIGYPVLSSPVPDSDGDDDPFQPVVASLAKPDPFGMIPAVYFDSAGTRHLRHGGLYTLRWSSGALKVPPDSADLKQGLVCPGDYNPLETAIGKATGAERGYIWKGDGSADIRDNIMNSGSQGRPISVGTVIIPDTGGRTTELQALNDRVAQDTDPSTQWFKDYLLSQEAKGAMGTPGNNRRVVFVPVNSGQCGPLEAGTTNPCTSSYVVVDLAAFFLQTHYDMGGTRAACAEYIGSGILNGGAGRGGNGSGVFAVRLIQ